MQTKPCKIQITSLGCPKNLVDTEVMSGQLLSAGFVLTPDRREADVVLVNTCGFIAAAREEADAEIRSALRWKRRGRGRIAVVTGCVPQRDPEGTRKRYPGADLILGIDDVPHIAERLTALRARNAGRGVVPITREPRYLYDHRTPRLQLTARNYAYVKIAEGCDNHCTFCSIPAIRGAQRSRAISSVVTECAGFLEGGVKELNLIAQDTTRYGIDRGDGASLTQLVRACDQLPGDFWLRLLYTHPRCLNDDLIEALAGAEHVVPYIDVPLQHVSDGVLRAMGRGLDGAATRERLRRLRAHWPRVAIRTTFLVGFPGETEADFAELLDFVTVFGFDRLGVFEYSREEGTAAARLTAPAVPVELAAERRSRLLAAQQALSAARNHALIGSRLRVLVDHAGKHGRLVGRTTADAPEIDGLVHFSGRADAFVEGFATVRITGAAAYDLEGTAE